MSHFWPHFIEILTDPAHLAVEFVFVLLDYLVIQVVVNQVKKRFRKALRDEHLRLDMEHGHPHPSPSLQDAPYDYAKDGL